MTDDFAAELLGGALDLLFRRDADLPHDVGERCVAHRIALYIEELLRSGGHGWSVDCEYDAMGAEQEPKKLAGLVGASRARGGQRSGLVVPDIIVHRRGPDGPNLLAIEVKWSWNDAADDLRKLALYKAELAYDCAFLIQIGESREHCALTAVS